MSSLPQFLQVNAGDSSLKEAINTSFRIHGSQLQIKKRLKDTPLQSASKVNINDP